MRRSRLAERLLIAGPASPRSAALAVLHAERGETAAAEPLFAASRARYRSVSPFPLAQLDFQRGRMWLRAGRLPARPRLVRRPPRAALPAYAPAQGHLAETEAALGEADAAIARLRPLTVSADDPDYAAQLARILGEAGQRGGGPDVARPRRRAITRSWSRATRRPSPTTRRNSGSPSAAIRGERSGSPGGTSRFVPPRVHTNSSSRASLASSAGGRRSPSLRPSNRRLTERRWGRWRRGAD